MNYVLTAALFTFFFTAHCAETDPLLDTPVLVECQAKIGALNFARTDMSKKASAVIVLKNTLETIRANSKHLTSHKKNNLEIPTIIDKTLATLQENYQEAYHEYMNACIRWNECGENANKVVLDINKFRTSRSCWYYLCCTTCRDSTRDPLELPYKPDPTEKHLITCAFEYVKKQTTSTPEETVSF